MVGSYAPVGEDRSMRDIELYRALLGLTAPWTVAGVDVDMTGQRDRTRRCGTGAVPLSGMRDARATV